jgi:hypothetical protein
MDTPRLAWSQGVKKWGGDGGRGRGRAAGERAAEEHETPSKFSPKSRLFDTQCLFHIAPKMPKFSTSPVSLHLKNSVSSSKDGVIISLQTPANMAPGKCLGQASASVRQTMIRNKITNECLRQ